MWELLARRKSGGKNLLKNKMLSDPKNSKKWKFEKIKLFDRNGIWEIK